MDCGIPFCHNGCPLGNLIPEWNDLAWRGDWARGDRAAARDEQLPGVHRPALPGALRDGLRARHQPARGDHQAGRGLDHRPGLRRRAGSRPQPPERLTGKTVAVVGSGPAGLAAAQQLTRAGHTVAVYERADKLGGLLRYGIPEFKMEKAVLDRRLAQMEAEGTRFRTGVDVGDDITGQQLRDRYDAVVLAIGATVAARPAGAGPRARRRPSGDGVPPAGQPGGARRAGRGPDHSPTGKHVVIIGGGDTGADCLGTAHRQGARVGDPAGDHAAARARSGRPASRGRPTR